MEQQKRFTGPRVKPHVVQEFSTLPKIYYAPELKGSRFNSRRQPLDPIPVRGTVSNFEETGFGFIIPDVNLEKLDGYSGRVFIHKNDLKFGMQSLEKDDRVTFFLYRDGKGIGAHSCCLIEHEDKAEEIQIKPKVSMLIPNKLMPRFIGRKGDTIDAISEGCDVSINIHNDKFRETRNELQLVVITGETENLTRACQEISSTLTASAASNSKMIFVIPEEQTGRFIGIKGSGINEIVEAEKDVTISVSNFTVNYKGSTFNKIILFGPQLKMKNSLSVLIPKLTKLHSTIVTDYLYGKKRTIRQNVPGNGRGRGRGGSRGRGRAWGGKRNYSNEANERRFQKYNKEEQQQKRQEEE